MLPQASVESLLRFLRSFKQRRTSLPPRFFGFLHPRGLHALEPLGNRLVPALVEAGCLPGAHLLFDKLRLPNVSSLISLILGYVGCGDPTAALALYEEVPHAMSAHMNGYGFIALLRACVQLRDLDQGCRFHAEIARRSLLDDDLTLANALLGMYIKCGALSRALVTFEKLGVRDVVTWTTLIGGCARHELCVEALEHFEQMMQREGINPNQVTFVCALKACGSLGNLHKGRQIHARMSGNEGHLDRGLLVGCALIDMYAKCGSLTRAVRASDRLFVRDVVSWTTLISGYVRHGHAEEALLIHEKMQLDSVASNAVTFVACLKACGSVENLNKGSEMHLEIMKKGLLDGDLHVGNALIDMYAKCGQIPVARAVFGGLPVQDVVSWNALLTGYMKQEDGKEVLGCYEKMQLQGISPDAVTYLCCLKACATIGDGDKGRELHAEIARKGFLQKKGFLNKDFCLDKALIDMYASCGLFANAADVLDELPVRDIVAWTAMIAGYAKHENGEGALDCLEQMKIEGIPPDRVTYLSTVKACGNIGAEQRVEALYSEISTNGLLVDITIGNALVDMYSRRGVLPKAQEIFSNLVHRDVISWTSLISGYAQDDQCKEALHCFEQMQLEGFSPDSATILCLLKTCGDLGAVDKGVEMHALIDQRGLLQTEVEIGNALIHMYARCGEIVKAQEVFDRIPAHDAISWTALMRGYAEVEESEKAFHAFDGMRKQGESPDEVAFLSVMTVCSHLGMVSKGEKYYEEMSKEYGIMPSDEHLSCLVDLFSRVGELDRAITVLKQRLPSSSDAVCRIMLDGIRRWGNIELGKDMFNHCNLHQHKEAPIVVTTNMA